MLCYDLYIALTGDDDDDDGVQEEDPEIKELEGQIGIQRRIVDGAQKLVTADGDKSANKKRKER